MSVSTKLKAASALHEAVAQLSPAQRTTLETLSAHSDPVTVNVLSEELGLHSNSVRVNLDVLATHGLIERAPIRQKTRGRPSVGYISVAPVDQEFASDQAVELLTTNMQVIRGLPVDAVEVVRSIGRDWAERLLSEGERGADFLPPEEEVDIDDLLSEHVSKFRDYFTSIGNAAVIKEDSPHTIGLYSCPFVNSSGRIDPLVCEMHRGLLTRLGESASAGRIRGELRPFVTASECQVSFHEVAS